MLFMDTLTKSKLVEKLLESSIVTKQSARQLVDDFFTTISDSIEGGENVRLTGFGKFNLRDKPARVGRNPKTGKIIPITARRVVTFNASKRLRARVTVLTDATVQEDKSVSDDKNA